MQSRDRCPAQSEGEEEVKKRYKGEFPVELTFPPRIVGQVRIRGALPDGVSSFRCFGDYPVARNMPAEDSEDTLINPGLPSMATQCHQNITR